MDLFHDDLEILDFVEAGFPRRIYNRQNYYEDMDNLTFFRRFRLTKPTVLNVLQQIDEQLEYPDDRNNSISPINQLLACLRCYATRIQSPGGDDAELFRNRKGFFSINTQVIGDASLKIRDVVARWPGSTHDQTIFANSRIRARFEADEFPNSVLLGDSGYAIKNYLLTPIPEPRAREEQLYNEAQIRTRNSIERLFGTWKRRFPILAYGCRLKLSTVLAVIPATAVLHNIGIDMREGEPPADENIEYLNYLIGMGNIPNMENHQGVGANEQIFRNEMVQYFANIQ